MSDNSKDQEKPKGPKPLPLEHKKVSNPMGPHGKKARLFPKAMAMYEQDYTLKDIAKELDIVPSTLRRWLRSANVPPKKKYEANPKPWQKKPSDLEAAKSIFDNIDHKNKQAIESAKTQIAEDETKRITDIASAQANPADQYQNYMAASAVKLMRDGIANMPPPKNVREMEVLDKIARRHFGLDERKGGQPNSLSIDINILNDPAAAAKKANVIDTTPKK